MRGARYSCVCVSYLGSDVTLLAAIMNDGDAPLAGAGQGERRRRLRHYDLLPARLLNPMGASCVETVDLPRLWRSMAAGNRQTVAFSELCLGDAERHGVGLSRFAEVMVLVINRLLHTTDYAECIKEDLWSAVMSECEGILPHFDALRGGLHAHSRHDLWSHAAAVHAWLSQPSSPLRNVIALLSAGGLFYVAQCYEKGTQAWLSAGGGTLDAMQAAMTARRSALRVARPDGYGGLEPQPMHEVE